SATKCAPSRSVRKMPSSCGAIRPSHLGSSPRLSMLCANPASTTSASSPSQLEAARPLPSPMATAVANPPRITAYEDLRLRKFPGYSLRLHAGLAVLLAGAAYFHLGDGNQWTGAGAGGDSVEVKLVTSAGIPMPKPNLPAESQVVDPTQTLHNIEPPKLEQPPPDATKLPKFEKEKPLPPSHKSKIFEPKKPPPDN